MKPFFTILTTFAVLCPVSAIAATSAWTDIVPGARLRAISAGIEIDGRALIGLELTLAPGFHTYWRVPGETGLPTELAVSDATGPLQTDLVWPLPERDTTGGYVDYVYTGTLVLPALVAAEAGAPLTLDVHMGICSDMCVPVQAHFELDGAERSDPVNSLRLQQALNETPILWEGDDVPLTDIRIDGETGAVTLSFDPARIDPRRIFPTLDGTSEVYDAPEIDYSAGTLRFALLTRKADTAWQGKPLRLTFSTSDGPYEIVSGSQ